MRISLLEPLNVPEEQIDLFAEKIRERGHQFTYYPDRTMDAAELKRRTAGQDVVMIANTPYPDEVILSADCLRLIAVAFTGIDHVGLKACETRGIRVMNCAGYSTQTVAELVIGLTLAAYRKLFEADASVRSGGTNAGLKGLEIAGKQVGIIGCGRIGTRCAELFQAFGADVCVFSRSEKPLLAQKGIRGVSLETLLSQSDIVSLHMPLTDETRGFLNAERIGLMKQGAVLINCARGPIVDSGALADALNEGRLAAAGIDVFDTEPPISRDNPLLHARNVLLTPHIGFLTAESMQRRAVMTFENVLSWLDTVS